MTGKASHDIGWIGLGRMGEAMAARLVKAGHGISVWNRTASKADPLAKIGAEVVTDKAAMAHCATVFTMVSTTDDLKDILFGQELVELGLVDPADDADLFLTVTDALGQRERRSDHIQQAEPEEGANPSRVLRVGDAGDRGCE